MYVLTDSRHWPASRDKNVNIGASLRLSKGASFNFASMVITSVELYPFIPVLITLTLSKGQSDARKLQMKVVSSRSVLDTIELILCSGLLHAQLRPCTNWRVLKGDN